MLAAGMACRISPSGGVRVGRRMAPDPDLRGPLRAIDSCGCATERRQPGQRRRQRGEKGPVAGNACRQPDYFDMERYSRGSTRRSPARRWSKASAAGPGPPAAAPTNGRTATPPETPAPRSPARQAQTLHLGSERHRGTRPACRRSALHRLMAPSTGIRRLIPIRRGCSTGRAGRVGQYFRRRHRARGRSR